MVERVGSTVFTKAHPACSYHYTSFLARHSLDDNRSCLVTRAGGFVYSLLREPGLDSITSARTVCRSLPEHRTDHAYRSHRKKHFSNISFPRANDHPHCWYIPKVEREIKVRIYIPSSSFAPANRTVIKPAAYSSYSNNPAEERDPLEQRNLAAHFFPHSFYSPLGLQLYEGTETSVVSFLL